MSSFDQLYFLETYEKIWTVLNNKSFTKILAVKNMLLMHKNILSIFINLHSIDVH